MSKKEVDMITTDMFVPGSDKTIVWITKDGELYIPLGCIGELFDKEFGHASEMVTKNFELFKGNVVKLKKEDVGASSRLIRFEEKSKTLTCLDLAGALQWMTLLNYKRYDEDRKNYIISMRRWLVDTGKKVLFEQSREEQYTVEWKEQRQICKETNKMLNKALHDHILPTYNGNPHWLYANEARMINTKAFGYHEKGMRDHANINMLFRIEGLEFTDQALCLLKITDYDKRKEILEEVQKNMTFKIEEKKKQLRGGQTTFF